MGPAVHKSSGQMRLSLSATAAAAVLYGAVVVFGLGPASPLSLGRGDDTAVPVVHVPHDSAVSGPVQRLPQVSPGPERHRAKLQKQRSSTRAETNAPAQTPRPDAPATPPRGPVSTPAPSGNSPNQSQPSDPTVSVLSSTPLPEPELTVPTISLPTIELPPPLPPAPTLPAVPSLPLP